MRCGRVVVIVIGSLGVSNWRKTVKNRREPQSTLFEIIKAEGATKQKNENENDDAMMHKA